MRVEHLIAPLHPSSHITHSKLNELKHLGLINNSKHSSGIAELKARTFPLPQVARAVAPLLAEALNARVYLKRRKKKKSRKGVN